jgi:hypothetical protein
MRLFWSNPKMVKLHPRLCPSQRFCSLEGGRVVVFIGQI